MLEAVTALSVLLKKFKFELACEPGEVEMITGATIHTKKGLPMKLKRR
jgi:cytochrome P450